MNESRRQILRMRANINRVKSEIIACIKLIAPWMEHKYIWRENRSLIIC